MDLKAFDECARTVWSEIPDSYKLGVDGLVIDRNAHTHPEHDDFFTLGECLTETYPSDFGGPDTIRSAVVLYYGSFRALALDDDGFDWRDEIHETILHELQHHLEHLADEDELDDLDHAVEAQYQRSEGRPFDPLFFRGGEQIAEHTYRVEDDVFIELRARSTADFEAGFRWQDTDYRVSIPESDADVLFVIVDADMPDVRGDFNIVRVLEKGTFATLRAALGGRAFTVEEVLVAVQQP